MFDLESVYKRVRTHARDVYGTRFVRGLMGGEHGFCIKNRAKRSIKVSKSMDAGRACIKVLVPRELLTVHSRGSSMRSCVPAPTRRFPDRVEWRNGALRVQCNMHADRQLALFFYEDCLDQAREDLLKLALATAADKAEEAVIVIDDN